MLTVGHKFPQYDLVGVTSNKMEGFKKFANQNNSSNWKVFFFWPKDFTFVCPTEIQAFATINNEFTAHNTSLYGVSTDSEFVHLAWRKDHKGLNNLPFPLLSDIKRELSSNLGILHKTEGVCLRTTFIVDPEEIIRHVSVNDLNVGRCPEEILRILLGLQNGGLMPCNWQPGNQTIQL